MASSSSTASPPLPRIVVLISGSGTNLQALIDATLVTQPTLPAQVIHVISNKKSAYGLIRAANHSIPTSYHNLLPYKSLNPTSTALARESYDADLAQLILAQKPDLVVCAGWMHILSPSFLIPLADADVDIINLHPALPGEFDGANAIARAYEKWLQGDISRTGVMIHRVISEVDRGQPLLTKEVQFREGETLQELEGRIHEVEHEIIVEGARMALEERARRKEQKEEKL
ncbi:formyl transferase [Terfezia claveryi]|nr:formyl transferase [Terfezia claveryi]